MADRVCWGPRICFVVCFLQGLVCFVFEECHETPSQIALLRMTGSGVGRVCIVS